MEETTALLPDRRSLSDSVLTAPLLWTQLWIRANNGHQRRAAGTFAIGYCSHLATDEVGLLVGCREDLNEQRHHTVGVSTRYQ